MARICREVFLTLWFVFFFSHAVATEAVEKKKVLYLANGYGFSKQLNTGPLKELVAALEDIGYEVWEPFFRGSQEDFSKPGWAYRIGQKTSKT